MPSAKTAQIVAALIEQGFNVVSAFKHSNPPAGFIDLSEHSNSFDDLVHIINAVDGVISVGTVVYHVSAALGKPTILLPTVQADIRSAELLPEVTTWLPEASRALILNLHHSDHPKHLTIAKQVWNNINAAELVKAIHDFF